jgi:hypothetical protein
MSNEVVDQARLSEFLDQRKTWIEWTVSSDENSLQTQFSSMFWADAVFRLVNETRRSANKNLSAYSGLLAELLDSGYVAGQAIAIRRLSDSGGDVISLRRVNREFEKHRLLITREVYVSHDGDPYDYERAEQEQLAEMLSKPPGEATFGKRGPELARRAHAEFDRLAKVDPANRSRNDLIDESVFQRISNSIDDSGAKAIVKSANKYLFHAADVGSRKNVPSLEPTLAQLSDVHVKLSRVGNCLSGQILGEGPCALGVATAQFDVLTLLDRPFIDNSDRDRLDDWWHAHAEQTFKLSYESLAL